MQLSILHLIKILFSQRSLNPNISLTLLFGQLSTLAPDPYSGHRLCRLRVMSTIMLPSNYTQVTLLFGQHHGALSGKTFMTTWFYLLPKLLYLEPFSQLWSPNSSSWNTIYIQNIFDHQAVQAITSQPIVPSSAEDVLRWTPARDGKCTTKNIYKAPESTGIFPASTTRIKRLNTTC